jgi:hypothetical protein
MKILVNFVLLTITLLISTTAFAGINRIDILTTGGVSNVGGFLILTCGINDLDQYDLEQLNVNKDSIVPLKKNKDSDDINLYTNQFADSKYPLISLKDGESVSIILNGISTLRYECKGDLLIAKIVNDDNAI